MWAFVISSGVFLFAFLFSVPLRFASHLITITFRYTKENMLNIKTKKGEISEFFIHLHFLYFYGNCSQFNLFAYIFHSKSLGRHDTLYYMKRIYLTSYISKMLYIPLQLIQQQANRKIRMRCYSRRLFKSYMNSASLTIELLKSSHSLSLLCKNGICLF